MIGIVPSGSTTPPARVLSVDALRGLIMLTMVFVNDVASVRAAPWWMKHYPAEDSGMTFVDVVFPAFLFIVGVSIPLAVQSRRSRGETWPRIWLHILVRTVSLLVLGVLMVNMPADAARLGWRPGLWETLVFICSIAAFMDVRRGGSPAARGVTAAVRVAAILGLLWLIVIYRGPDDRWLRTQWWGILGLIGWAYLVACIIYVPLRKAWPALLVGVALLLGLYFIDRRGALTGWWIRNFIDLGSQIGGHGSITLAGAVLGSILLPASRVRGAVWRIVFAACFGGAMAMAAVALHPTFGINKNSATPSWCLWSSAITAWLWIVTYILFDLVGLARIRWLFLLAGTNALLIYLLHPLLYRVMQLFEVQWYWRLGGGSMCPGIGRAAAIAIVLTLLAGVLNRASVRLRL